MSTTIIDSIDSLLNSIKESEQKYGLLTSGKPLHHKEYEKLMNDIIFHNEYEEFYSKSYDDNNSILNEINNNNFIYPSLNDPLFTEKITLKKEFSEHFYPKYNGSIEEISTQLCNREFEIAPHQQFVKTFLSNKTPYNSLLLYHGLGTGKTCSAISICEEMRQYIQQFGIKKRIIVVASPNVQENFKKQLFDASKLQNINGYWNIQSCAGRHFIHQINPFNNKNLPKNTLINEVKRIIRETYRFMGYTEFSNWVSTIVEKTGISTNNIKPESNTDADANANADTDLNINNKRLQKIINKEFSNRLLVIDEVHNIRISGDTPNKKVAENLLNIVKYTENFKLLLLSATPMYNEHKEIIWLTNLMNRNDKRSTIDIKDVFNNDGTFKTEYSKQINIYDDDGNIVDTNDEINESGQQLLRRKLLGYVSFIRGENPYTFPFRIYPSLFNIHKTNKQTDFIYPQRQINGMKITTPILHSDIYLNELQKYQYFGYKLCVNKYIELLPEDEISTGVGWQKVEPIIQSLNIIYPNSYIDTLIEKNINIDDFVERKKKSDADADADTDADADVNVLDINSMIGSSGLKQIMDYDHNSKTEFKYYPHILEKYGRIFDRKNLNNFSHKFSSIMDSIINSTGVVVIFSQYIHGGCIPIALALEELGIQRQGQHNLFSEYKDMPKALQRDIYTGKRFNELTDSNEKNRFIPAKYTMITGDKYLSPSYIIEKELQKATSESNVNGQEVKVIIISRAGSEGIDMKYIRQIHICEPWYNMSRIEQIIGRGIRYCSHSKLPITERNCEIYLHGTKPITNVSGDNNDGNGGDDSGKTITYEPMDLYIYRIAEYKAIQIGKISRIMKEIAIDCYLNHNISDLGIDKIGEFIKINLSSGQIIDYPVGDKPYSSLCDYMESCDYTCNKNIPELYQHNDDVSIKDDDISKILDYTTYDESFIRYNIETIINKIIRLFKSNFIYKKDEIYNILNQSINYGDEAIAFALYTLNNNRAYKLIDKFGRIGYMKSNQNYYYFQPDELENKYMRNSLFDFSRPLQYLRTMVIPNNAIQLEHIEKKNISEFNDYLHYIYNTKKTVIKKKTDNVNINKNSFVFYKIFTPEIIQNIINNPNKDENSVIIILAYFILFIRLTIDKRYSNTIKLNNVIKHINKQLETLQLNIAINKDYKIQTLYNNQLNWFSGIYKFSQLVTEKTKSKNMLSTIFDINTDIYKYAFQHFFDNLEYNVKLNLIQQLNTSSFVANILRSNKILLNLKSYVFQYIDSYHKIGQIRNGTGYVLADKEGINYVVINKNTGNISFATPSQEEELRKIVFRQQPKITQYMPIVGFMSYIMKEFFYDFKTKLVDEKRTKGARCIQSGKKNISNVLTFLYNKFGYTFNESIKTSIVSLCVKQEFLFRYLQENDKAGNIWFLPPELSTLYKFENVSRFES